MHRVTTPPDRDLPTEGLDRALASLDIVLHGTRAEPLRPGDVLDRTHPGPGIIYVADGRIRSELGSSPCRCTLDMSAGDLVFFPRGLRHRTDPREDGALTTIAFTPGVRANPALDTLPGHLVVRGFRDREPTIAALIERTRCDDSGITRMSRPGDSVICNTIAHTILVVAVRAWVELCTMRWAALVPDPHIARAVEAVNTSPGHPWTLDELARIATMSRSVFAERFRDSVGRSPATYVASIRMDAGKRLLGDEDLSVAETAQRLGYTSEAGFSRAFRRHVGMAPAHWRRTAQQQTVSAVGRSA